MPDPDAIRATIDDYVAHLSRGDREAWLGLFAEGATVEDPVGTPRHEGREAIGAFFDLVSGMADRLTLEVTGPVLVVGVEAAWPMQAFSAIGDDTYVVDIIDVMSFDEAGRIVSLRAFWDPAALCPA